MTFGQIPNATPEQFNGTTLVNVGWLVVGAIVATAIGTVVSAFRRGPSGEQYVTKDELKADTDKLSKAIEGCASKESVKELATQLRESVHKLRDDIQPLTVDVATVKIIQQNQQAQLTALTAKVDGSHDILLEMRSMLRKTTPPPPTSAA